MMRRTDAGVPAGNDCMSGSREKIRPIVSATVPPSNSRTPVSIS